MIYAYVMQRFSGIGISELIFTIPNEMKAMIKLNKYKTNDFPCEFRNSGTSKYTKDVANKNGTDTSKPAK